MTAEKLYGILKFLDNLDKSLGLETGLEGISNALSNLSNQPANPQHQSQLASALTTFEAAASKIVGSISPSQFAVIKAMGGEEFFDPLIFDKVKNAVQTNAMTPTVARDFVQGLVSRRTKFLSIVRTAHQSLEGLNVRESELKLGSADLAFLIPREIFDNQLGAFAKELTFINRLVEHFSEAATPAAQPAQLEYLSSSDPTVALLADVIVIGMIATVVNKFLDAWEKIERIRKIRTELAEVGLKGEALEELDERITTTVEEVVEESTTLVLANYKGPRKNELENGVRQDTRRLFGQIERGLRVEIRAKEDPKGKQPEGLESISGLAGRMKFPDIAKDPMLLDRGKVLEGDIVTLQESKKTTTRKTTLPKKGPKGDDLAE